LNLHVRRKSVARQQFVADWRTSGDLQDSQLFGRLINSMRRTPRPKLGQHFLADPRIQQRLVDSISLSINDLVVEVGPGKGAVTRLLAERVTKVVAIELDPELAKSLQAAFLDDPRVEVVEGDILRSDLGAICRRHDRERCFVFGNLPYYITSPILHHLFDSHRAIGGMALLVQREVAERITAAPGSRARGYLSVLAQVYSTPRVVLSVPPGAFSPPPKVQSALVGFKMIPPDPKNAATAPFLSFVKLCFAKKRKSLVNNLGPKYVRTRVELTLAASGLSRTARAEQLSVDELNRLYRRLQD